MLCGEAGMYVSHFLFQAEDGIRGLVRSRGLGDVYKGQGRHAGSEADRPVRHDHGAG